MSVLNDILAEMKTAPKPRPSKSALFPDRPALTQMERNARSKLKKRLLGAGSGAGSVDRISEIVVKQVRRGLQPRINAETGEVMAPILGVTVRDGLLAEKMIDTRVNRIDDRKAMLAVAAMLTGSGAPPPEEMLELDDGMTIEGEFEDLDDDD